MTRRRAGTSYAELALVCVVMGVASFRIFVALDGSTGQARDAAVRADLNSWNRALASWLLAHGGRPPADLFALRPGLLVPSDRDPYRWRGGSGGGRFALRGGVVKLEDDAGRPPAGRDARGRAYADYR